MNPITLTNGIVVTQQPDGTYKSADGKVFSAAAIAPFMPKQAGSGDPSDPYGGQWTGDARVAALKAAGYVWLSGSGPSALWSSPEGAPTTEISALTRVINEGARPPSTTTDRSLQTGINPATGKAEMFGVGSDGQPVWTGVAPVSSASADRGFAPQYGSYTEETTGDRVFTTNGQVTSRIPGATWAALSPQEQFQQESALRKQMDDAAMAREAAGNASRERTSAATESGINSRFGISATEGAAMDRAQLAENARQANLQSATSAFGDVTRLAPQLGQLALSNAEFTKDTLRNAPDYLARAFFQQGQTSPLPQVSQADIINQLRSNIQGFNSTLQGFNPQVGAYQAPPAFNPAATVGFSAPAAAAPVTTQGSGLISAGGVPGVPQPNPYNAPAWTPQQVSDSGVQTAGGFRWDPNGTGGIVALAHGGFTNDPMMRVGDSPSGKPNATEETVLNPTGAPIGVVPNPATAESPDMKKRQQAHDGIAKIIGFVSDTKLQHELVDEMAKHAQPEEMPRYATGTFGDFSTPKPAEYTTTEYSNPGVQQAGFGNYAGGLPLAGSTTIGNWYDSPYLNATTAGTKQTISGSGVLSDYVNPTGAQRAIYNIWNSGGIKAPAGMDFTQWAAAGQPSAPASSGENLMGFSLPSLPSPAEANQADIMALEAKNRPPALNTLLGGGTPNESIFGFNLFTPNQLNSLTPDDREALGTTLATQYNETAPNVEAAIKRRWSTGNRRTAGARGF